MASETSLKMRFDKKSLTNHRIFPMYEVKAKDGGSFFISKSLDGEYYGSQSLGGPITNITKYAKRLGFGNVVIEQELDTLLEKG